MINRLVVQCRWPVVGTGNIVAYTPGKSALVSWIVLALVRVLWRGRKGGLAGIPRHYSNTMYVGGASISFRVRMITGLSGVLRRVSDFIGLLCAALLRV
jgi:hypothetical protein